MGLDEIRNRLTTNKNGRNQKVFMSYDDIPNEFLDKLEDGLDLNEIDNELEEHGFDADEPQDAIDDLEQLGFDINAEREDGTTVYSVENLDPEFSNIDTNRVGSASKQTITRAANDYLEKKEREVAGYRRDLELSDYPRHEPTDGALTQVNHISDTHFGDEITDERGNTIYDSEDAQGSIAKVAAENIRFKEEMEESGYDVENMIVVLGGDMVTNESIYDSQPHDIDKTVDEQIDMATATLVDVIEMYNDEYDHVKVVAQHGNHGDFRVDGSSSGANADDILYNFLEMYYDHQDDDNENVQFVQSNATNYTNFNIRGHKGHLRHGDSVLQHIGTSAAQNRWYAHLEEHEFDIGFRGHYHTFKEEPIHGNPVYESPSPAPGDDFSEKIGAHSDESLIGYTVFSSDEEVDFDRKKIHK